MRRALILLIRGYQLLISPLFPPSCRFIPSCSEYAKQALEVHGLVKGSGLSAWRLLRCHPFCSGGLDPVPEPLTAGAPVSSPEHRLGPRPLQKADANLNPPNP
ncbi:MAG: membrane protein insertion efficiency factor YidD [Desulfovibrionales bacterium]|uniref:membrane protein insertion efficiency factor YidD n=1 Tax=Desulfonatronum thioautotrophicum TaxID=617001 RepID=UPI0005EB86B4|nr:membrane protein insertion efficiency factor YidD [Desulfonatronum thioautotrophicum]TVR00298.1 MAG: membrane protein insertion efficiency factor YidD [Desulfovibrionales bacterium]